MKLSFHSIMKPWYHLEMVRVAYFYTDYTMNEEAIQKIEEDLGIEVTILPLYVDDLARLKEDLQRLEQQDYDIVICRGIADTCIRKIGCPLPYMPIIFSDAETLQILNGIKKRLDIIPKNEKLKVGLVSHQALNINEDIFSQILEMQIHNIVLDSEDPEDIRILVNKLIKDEYDIIACGHTIKKVAESMGMKCFYEPDHRDVFFKEGFRTAISIAKANIEIKQKKKELETLIDYSFNSVMTLDESGSVSISNNAASKMFRLSKQEIIGEHISNIIPQLNKTEIDGVLKNGKNIFGRIIDITHSVIVVNVNPVIHGTEIKGAVANFVILRENDRIDSSPVPENKGGHSARYNFKDIIGESESISETKRLAFQFAKYDSNVLILGETGTGKELFAQSIHNNSLRNSGPFVAVNCGAIPLNLLESELFGYVEGAFTGALKKGKKGLIELADNGTIFLDEISEMDLHAQIRLLRVLEERSITRVGSNEVKPVNIRVIAASNKNLMQLIEKEKFREDLFYRLNVLTLYVPPLRKRDTDPVLLTNHFLQKFGRAFKKSVQIEDQVKEVILSFDWTGNIRQLKNFCERLMVIADENIISADFVRQQLEDIYMLKIKPGLTEKEPPAPPVPHGANHEKEQIISALNETGGNRIRAAEKLGISKATLWRKMTKHEISGKF